MPFAGLLAARQRLAASSFKAASARAFSSTRSARKLIQLEIDGKQVEVEQGSSLIQACEAAGATIPRFCYHDRLAIAGNCRMCLVEVSPGPPKPQASCAMPAMPGQKVKTNSPLVHKAREGGDGPETVAGSPAEEIVIVRLVDAPLPGVLSALCAVLVASMDVNSIAVQRPRPRVTLTATNTSDPSPSRGDRLSNTTARAMHRSVFLICIFQVDGRGSRVVSKQLMGDGSRILHMGGHTEHHVSSCSSPGPLCCRRREQPTPLQ